MRMNPTQLTLANLHTNVCYAITDLENVLYFMSYILESEATMKPLKDLLERYRKYDRHLDSTRTAQALLERERNNEGT